MTTAVQYAALACVAAGLLAGMIALIVARDVATGLRVALDLWLAAGLLHLAAPAHGWQVAGAAAIIAVRQLAGQALRHRHRAAIESVD
jgi:hypothetical protein